MPRQSSNYERPAPFRDASVVFIAVEGAVTEPWYFGELRKALRNQRIKEVHVIPCKDGTKSAPKHVIDNLVVAQKK